ncbi:MAG: hypothetical protein JKX91_06550 [Rhizobiaceae bacterium]|nr:hypothetical protein [Rhizobiaceae bacterium]
MSIKQQNEINELRERVENLERKMNKVNNEPRTVAGVPDFDPKPVPKKTKSKG